MSLVFPILCFTGALIAAVFAIICQCRDIVPGYGNTMGSEMLVGGIWSLVSILCATGSVAFIPWCFSALILIVIYAFSFVVRLLIERLFTSSAKE